VTDHEARRAILAETLRVGAERRFGAARAEALSHTLGEAAELLARLADVRVDIETSPAFYMEKPDPRTD
jgi:hypothetical protein